MYLICECGIIEHKNPIGSRYEFSGHVKNGVIYINDLQYEKNLKDAGKPNKYDKVQAMYDFINKKR